MITGGSLFNSSRLLISSSAVARLAARRSSEISNPVAGIAASTRAVKPCCEQDNSIHFIILADKALGDSVNCAGYYLYLLPIGAAVATWVIVKVVEWR